MPRGRMGYIEPTDSNEFLEIERISTPEGDADRQVVLVPETDALLDYLGNLLENFEAALTAIQNAATEGKVKDDYQQEEVLLDQDGADDVLDFTFVAGWVQLIVVRSVGGDSRAATSEQPSATFGIRCPEDEPVYLPVEAGTVYVYAPSGTTISVYGLRRA